MGALSQNNTTIHSILYTFISEMSIGLRQLHMEFFDRIYTAFYTNHTRVS